MLCSEFSESIPASDSSDHRLTSDNLNSSARHYPLPRHDHLLCAFNPQRDCGINPDRLDPESPFLAVLISPDAANLKVSTLLRDSDGASASPWLVRRPYL